MFYECTSIEEINFSNFKASSNMAMTKMFYGCTQLKSLDLSTFNTSQVTNMIYMFYECNSLKFLDISNFDARSISEDIGITFEGLNNTKYINLDNVQNFDKLKSSILKLTGKSDLIVCQKDDIIDNVMGIGDLAQSPMSFNFFFKIFLIFLIF